jgi:mono/diheme cytochrome c family protein
MRRNKLFKALAWAALAPLGVLALLVAYAQLALPRANPVEEVSIEATPARLARGKYLAEHVSDCMGCHSLRDWSLYGAPVRPGSEYGGGSTLFDQRLGLPGSFPPRNLTPFNLKRYSDGELVRALRCGVSHEGGPLMPVMPYDYFREYSREDLYSIIAWLRSLPVLIQVVPPAKPLPGAGFFIRSFPSPAPAFEDAPPPSDRLRYGRYMARAAACGVCHTPLDKRGRPLPGMDYAGGIRFPSVDFESPGPLALEGGGIVSTNLTPDPETGIGTWTEKDFLDRFRAWRGKSGQAMAHPVKKGEAQTYMPWSQFAGMSDQDLGAVFYYLKSLPPVKNRIVKFTPPKGF